jgi:FkbM family methyltransferase
MLLLMSTHTQSHHWSYTLNEWSRKNYQEYLDIIFEKNNIKYICDIGANVGGTTYIFLDYIKKHNKNINNIYCFEPDIENMNFLKTKLNSDINNNRIICINKGIYYGKKYAKVFGAGHISENKIHENVGGYGIEECMKEMVNYRNSGGEKIFCEQISDKVFELDTFENLMKNFNKPDLIKIDVEGAEKNILINSQIIKSAKYIIIEWCQKDSLSTILEKYLPNFKIIKSNGDYLLKNINNK